MAWQNSDFHDVGLSSIKNYFIINLFTCTYISEHNQVTLQMKLLDDKGKNLSTIQRDMEHLVITLNHYLGCCPW